jgi:hypothetical protein
MLIGELSAQFFRIFALPTPSLIVCRLEADSMHSHTLLPNDARNIGIHLPLPLESAPSVKKAAIFFTFETDELQPLSGHFIR